MKAIHLLALTKTGMGLLSSLISRRCACRGIERRISTVRASSMPIPTERRTTGLKRRSVVRLAAHSHARLVVDVTTQMKSLLERETSCTSSCACMKAVIGAGAAGLAAARELRLEGHEPTIFEQGSQLGGVWAYEEAVEEEDLLGKDPLRTKVHSSMYRDLRTNLPREIMGFQDFPFTPENLGKHCIDPRRYCSHVEVASYLNAYAEHFQLKELIQFNTIVERVTPFTPRYSGSGIRNGNNLESSAKEAVAAAAAAETEPGHEGQRYRWHVRARRLPFPEKSAVTGSDISADSVFQAEFDAVMVCNGHYSEPKLPDQVTGMNEFQGLQMHSHNYRSPEQFQGQVVLVVGASNSGLDICREVGSTAKQVLLSARTWPVHEQLGPSSPPFGAQGNLFKYPMVQHLAADGCATFPDGLRVGPVDSVIYCTGYQYSFPFLIDDPGSCSDHDPHQNINGCGSATATTTAKMHPGHEKSHVLLLPGCAAATAAAAQRGSRGTEDPANAAAGAAHEDDATATPLSVLDQRVGPLWAHLLSPGLGPEFSFLGLPWKVVPFPQLQLQAKLVARALSGRVHLPPEAEMWEQVEEKYRQMRREGVPLRYTHMQNLDQWAYNDSLAAMCGPDVPMTPAWRVRMYQETALAKRKHPETYRDGPWSKEDQEALAEAHVELHALTTAPLSVA